MNVDNFYHEWIENIAEQKFRDTTKWRYAEVRAFAEAYANHKLVKFTILMEAFVNHKLDESTIDDDIQMKLIAQNQKLIEALEEIAAYPSPDDSDIATKALQTINKKGEKE